MGKFVLTAIALLALSPMLATAVSRGTSLPPAEQKELNREERRFQEDFAELEDSYNCPNFDYREGSEQQDEFDARLVRLNARRRNAYTSRKQSPPSDFFCEGGSGA